MGATGLMAGMMGLSAFSSVTTAISQRNALKAQGEYASSLADTNAQIAGIEARQTIEAGNTAASRRSAQAQQVTGAIRAAQGASGTDVNSTSNTLTRLNADFAGRIDEMTIRNNAARQAWGYKMQALQDTYQGQFTKMAANNKAEQTLLTGGLQAIEGPLGIYANYKKWSSRYSGGSGEGIPFDTTTSEWSGKV